MADEASPESLPTRYYDWCSAKIAEQCLRLSPEEVWTLTALEDERAASAAAGGAAPEPGAGTRTPFDLVRILAGRIAQDLQLPSFDDWVDEYRRDPARFEREILTLGMAPRASSPGASRPSD